jgi:hypothetical protein
MNLPEPFLAYNYTVTSKADLPNSGGLLFPFVAALCKPDSETVYDTLQRYFFHALGSDLLVAKTVLSNIKVALGVLKQTMWGDELAHMYSCIRLCLETGAAAKVMTTSANVYQGFFLYGGSFQILHLNDLYESSTYEDIQIAFESASPHHAALTNIMEKVNFADDLERQNIFPTITNVYSLAKIIREKGYNANDEQSIRQNAVNLIFPNDNYLPITANNISRVFLAMTTSGDEEARFPVHPLAVLEKDKKKRLLSAFGAHAPTFLVPGGRSMSLTSKEFTYKVKEGKSKVDKTVTKMYCQVVPLEKAQKDLDTVLTSKTVHSLIGTNLARRASTVSLTREFEGTSGTQVLAALRSVVGVSVGTGAGVKRKAEDDLNDESRKKRVDAMFEF